MDRERAGSNVHAAQHEGLSSSPQKHIKKSGTAMSTCGSNAVDAEPRGPLLKKLGKQGQSGQNEPSPRAQLQADACLKLRKEDERAPSG